MSTVNAAISRSDSGKIRHPKMGMIEVWRFLFMLFIMAHHMYHLGLKGGYLFRGAWVYVEFFFILTGGFTLRHFEKDRMVSSSAGDAAHEAIVYTLRKFSSFFGYVVAAVFLEYFLQGFSLLASGQLVKFVLSFQNMPFEVLLLSSSGMINPKLAPVWYLSAMFLVMPLFCYVIQKYRNIFVSIGCWLLPVLYYGRVGVNSLRDWPHDMLRAFACMSLGAFAYLLGLELRKIEWKRWSKFLLTAAEVGGLALTIFFTGKNWELNKVMVLLFVIGAAVMFSGCSYTALVSGKLFEFLGKITLPMFLLHWAVGTLAKKLFQTMEYRILFYYLVTILLSIVLYLTFQGIRKIIGRRVNGRPGRS